MNEITLSAKAIVKLQVALESLTHDFAKTPPAVQRLVRNLVERATEAEARVKELEAELDTLRDVAAFVVETGRPSR